VQNLNDGDIKFLCDDGSGGTAQYFRLDGGLVETSFLKTTHHYDNVKANFGDGEDLQIYHDSSDSYIKDTGTGDLRIDTSKLRIRNTDGAETMIIAAAHGSVDLYYDDFKKFETTSTGVRISGVSEYANNTAALAGGLVVGDVYRTGDDLKIVH
jgi:hypothetical protein